MSGNPVFSGTYVKQQARKLLITFDSGYHLSTMGKFERLGPVELHRRVHAHFFGGSRTEPWSVCFPCKCCSPRKSRNDDFPSGFV